MALSPAAMTEKANHVAQEVSKIVGGAEALRVAQSRITQLEQERDQLRDETEKLLSHNEGLQRRVGELKSELDGSERKFRQKVEILEEEKSLLKGRLSAREQELQDIKLKYDEIQVRFQNDLRKVRVRERELENRLTILKSEASAVTTTKDESILELRRQLEQLNYELDNYKAKSSELNLKLNEFHDRNHRTAKALRLALSMLENGDVIEEKKKVG
jgi:chromosome segregation ATPase